jgi:hypothetical protein
MKKGEEKNPKELIFKTIKEKSILKQDVYRNTKISFELVKNIVKKTAEEYKGKFAKIDERICIEYIEISEFEIHLKLAGDILIFNMHTNVFDFDKGHVIWQNSYIANSPENAYCGMINIYNFLSDSFKYNRINDLGYLIARVFVNKDFHFFVEGKRQLGFLYNDFANNIADEISLEKVIDSAILYSLDFDLLTPPYANMQQLSVFEMKEWSTSLQTKTGKRLGFKFQSDSDTF